MSHSPGNHLDVFSASAALMTDDFFCLYFDRLLQIKFRLGQASVKVMAEARWINDETPEGNDRTGLCGSEVQKPNRSGADRQMWGQAAKNDVSLRLVLEAHVVHIYTRFMLKNLLYLSKRKRYHLNYHCFRTCFVFKTLHLPAVIDLVLHTDKILPYHILPGERQTEIDR